MSGAFFLLLCLTSTGSGDNGTIHIIRETGGKSEENMEEEEEITRYQPHTNGQTKFIIL